MKRAPALVALAGAAALGGCGPTAAPEREGNRMEVSEAEPETINIPQTVTEVAPGTTPMAQRVAVVRILNKRNGERQELTMRPGQALRWGDVVVRLRACETTAPWEEQNLTGAFVQVDVRNVQGRFQRVFSGWLYKESPGLNVVEHPIYDVWPMSCAMTHPGAESESTENSVSNRSSAPNSGAPSASPPSGPPGTAEPRAPVSNSI
jgi:hypothetical protein